MTVRNEGGGATVVWTVEGVKHDHVENFYMDMDTKETKVRCYHDCMCKKEK